MDWSENMNDDGGGDTAAAANKLVRKPKRRFCTGHEVAFSIDETVQALDIPEENVATLLCYLELHEQRYIRVLSKAYCMCKVTSYGGPATLRVAAKSCAPLAMAIALQIKRGKSFETEASVEFHIIEVAAAIGWDSGVVKYQLKNLEWTTDENGQPKRSKLSVVFSDLGLRVKSPGDLSDEELDETLDLLHRRAVDQEQTQLIQVIILGNKVFQDLMPL